MSRFEIDQRVGCIAIIDTEHPKYTKDHAGLGSHLPYVLWYSNGKWDEGDWTVEEETIKEAKERLNHFKRIAGEPFTENELEYVERKVIEVPSLGLSYSNYSYLVSAFEFPLAPYMTGMFKDNPAYEALDRALTKVKDEKIILCFGRFDG